MGLEGQTVGDAKLAKVERRAQTRKVAVVPPHELAPRLKHGMRHASTSRNLSHKALILDSGMLERMSPHEVSRRVITLPRCRADSESVERTRLAGSLWLMI